MFLLLIATNQAAEVASALMETPQARQAAYRIGFVAAALDPAVLVWFASSLADARWFRRTWILAVFVVLSGSLALYAAFFLTQRPVLGWAEAALITYTIFTYLALTADRVRPALAEARWGAASFALLAYALATIPAIGLQGERLTALLPAMTHPQMARLSMLLDVIILLAATSVLVFAAWWARRDPLARRRLAWILAACIALWLALDAYHIARFALIETRLDDPRDLRILGQAAAPLRWLLFSGLMSVALIRADALALSLSERRRAARVLIGLAALVAAGLLLAGTGVEVRGLDVAIIALLVLIPQGFRRGVERIAWWVYGVPMPGDLAARQDAYRSAVARAVAEGRLPVRDAQLQALREELEIDPAMASALEREADDNSSQVLARGLIVAGRYHIEKLIGRGDSGRLFLARDEVLHRHVAIKELILDPEADQERSLREARLAARVRSPHVVTLHDVIRKPHAILLVSELVDGGNLASRAGSLTPEDAGRAVSDLLEGLAAIHDAGVVHGALSAANVLLTSAGTAKISDFGIARAASAADVTVAASSAALPVARAALAPELIAGGPRTPASDVHAAGRLVGEILQDVSEEQAAVLARAIERDPSARWRDAGEMLTAWRHAARRGHP